jgi:hypothetical protein
MNYDLTTIGVSIIVFIVLFFVFIQIARWYVCYVAKINVRIQLMERQNILLALLAQKAKQVFQMRN